MRTSFRLGGAAVPALNEVKGVPVFSLLDDEFTLFVLGHFQRVSNLHALIRVHVFITMHTVPLRSSTLLRNSSYYSRFLAAASLTMWLNVSRSSEKSTASVFAMIVAARGTLYSNASSPNDSPGP